MPHDDVMLSIIVPAYNEAAYLPRYLPTVTAALRLWEVGNPGLLGEVIVVDNNSTDDTGHVAASLGARVVTERHRNIGAARNAGATTSRGRYLLFIDADVAVPVNTCVRVVQVMSSGAVGGAIPAHYACRKASARLLCRYWDWRRRRHGGAQGVAQFCTADAFAQLGGYRADLYMSEDHDFFHRLSELGTTTGRPVVIDDTLSVEASTRRYDTWPTWRMLWWQNPITARLFLTSPRFWRHWYSTTVR